MSQQKVSERRAHLSQVDLLRILPMIGVVATHVLIYTAPVTSVGAGAVLMALHVNRELFFFVSAFVLFYATRAAERDFEPKQFWRRRYPLIVLPYVAWTLIYWVLTLSMTWPPGPGLRTLGGNLLTGWFHLYFLLVTMQFYALFPVLAWLVRRTRGRHWWLLGASVAFQLLFTSFVQYGWYQLPWVLQQVLSYGQVEFPSYQLFFIAGALAAVHLPECLAWIRAHTRWAVAGTAAMVAVGEGWYWLNLLLGEPPANASGVFQPAIILLALAGVVGLWLLAERWLTSYSLDGRLWGLIRMSANASFGIYLSHMVVLLAITSSPFLAVLPTWKLPWMAGSIVRFVMVMVGTVAIVAISRRTPLSKVLMGRPRLRHSPPQRRWLVPEEARG